MDTVRLRLTFDKALSDSLEKTDGLKRFWVLLNPQHKTISDLSHYLLDAFDLHNACPDGLLLSMEGFFLPPFESTSVLKDRDIVRVKRKSGEIIKLGHNGQERADLGMLEFVGHRSLAVAVAPMKLLANEEFEKETGGYESDEPEEEDDAELEDILHVEEKTPEMKKVSKKRKASEEPESSKKKKRKKKSFSTEKCGDVIDDSENNIDARKDTKSYVAADKKKVKKDRKASDGTPNAKKSSEPKGCCSDHVDASCPPSETKKLPSRSARRKKAKRQWLRELRRAEKKEEEEKQLSSKPNQKASQKKKHKAIEKPADKQKHSLVEELPNKGDSTNVQAENQQSGQVGDKDDEVVPVVIRPGHIRFEPLQKGSADQSVQQNLTLLETSQWNGMSKKKGQKWGSQKSTSWQWNDNGKSSHKPSETWKDNTNSSHKPSETWNHDANSSHKPSETRPVEKEPAPFYNQIDFDKLSAYAHSPKEGDIIAYRLIQLSSSWTPELSTYLVGRISKFNPQTNKIKLVPVPNYPLIPDNKLQDEESEVLPETCSLQEDGSLVMDFTSLLEVRAVNPSSTDSAKATLVNEASPNKVQCTPENGTKNHTSSQEQREATKNPWDEISQALSAKKAELSQEDNNWTVTESSGRNQWSFKALRGSALGPTMALLRSQNGI
ncbi:unnamed protein product [Linum trigynum]|uniref:Coilin n=1 Tax=Linum trigynum TaxID=586398 RepID=A0AAV2FC19_9ROSI